jgi:hypothetical protein
MQLLFLLFRQLQEMVNDVLEFLLQLIFWVLEAVHKERLVLAINLRNDMMPEMLDFMVSQKVFKEFESMEIELFILLNTIIGHNFKVNISRMVNDSASYNKMRVTWLEIFENGVGKKLIGFGTLNFHKLAKGKWLFHKVPYELHELVDTMFIEKGPLLAEISVKSFIKAETIFPELLGEGVRYEWYGCGKMMLVDHFIKVPQTIEQSLDNIGKSGVIKIGRGEVGEQFLENGVHSLRSWISKWITDIDGALKKLLLHTLYIIDEWFDYSESIFVMISFNAIKGFGYLLSLSLINLLI